MEKKPPVEFIDMFKLYNKIEPQLKQEDGEEFNEAMRKMLFRHYFLMELNEIMTQHIVVLKSERLDSTPIDIDVKFNYISN